MHSMLLLGAVLSPCGHSLLAAPIPYAGKVAVNGVNFSGMDYREGAAAEEQTLYWLGQ